MQKASRNYLTEMEGATDVHFTSPADGGIEGRWIGRSYAEHSRDGFSKSLAHLYSSQIVSRKVEHADGVTSKGFLLKSVAPNAGVRCEETPAFPPDFRKPFNVLGAWVKKIQKHFAMKTCLFDCSDNVPIAAMVLVEENDQLAIRQAALYLFSHRMASSRTDASI